MRKISSISESPESQFGHGSESYQGKEGFDWTFQQKCSLLTTYLLQWNIVGIQGELQEDDTTK